MTQDSPPPNGFWAQAAADPDRTVLIAPDGEEWTAGRLHAASNRLVHGLRAAGLERGDAFAVVLPNGVEFFTAYLAASQAGFYLVPVNHHLVGPEIAWIVADSGAKVLIAHERFAEAARHAADEAKLPGDAPLRRRPHRRLPAVRPTPRRTAGVRARRPHPGLGHELHLGHHRAPARHPPPAARHPPRTPTSAVSSASSASSRSTTTSIWSARRSTTRPCCNSPAPRCTSATASS